jgi:hypothetical protein
MCIIIEKLNAAETLKKLSHGNRNGSNARQPVWLVETFGGIGTLHAYHAAQHEPCLKHVRSKFATTIANELVSLA